jgi:transposase
MLHVKAIVEGGKCSSDLKFLYEHYKNVESSLNQSTQELIEYAKSNFPKEWEKLHSIDGIADIISSYIIANVHPIARFANEKKLRRYAGVIPCFQESAGKFHGSMLPKTSSRALLRWALTQAAHGAIRKKDSNLSLYYKSKMKRSKHKAIMAVARSICDLVYMRLRG